MGHDPNRLIGPIGRSDIIAVVCLGLAIYLGIAEEQWESIAFALALVGGIYAGLSPRFQGHFGLKVGDWLEIGATFDRPVKPPRVQTPGEVRILGRGGLVKPQPPEAGDAPSREATRAED